MPELPAITGREAIAAFEKVGFVIVRTTSSHVIMKRDEHRFLISVPVHRSENLKRGLLRSLIRGAGLTVEQFCELLD